METLNSAMNVLAQGSKDDRLQFLKRFLSVMNENELDAAKGITRKARRRTFKGKATVCQPPKGVYQPVVEPEEDDPVPKPAKGKQLQVDGWWEDSVKKKRCLALDVEKVSVPVNPDECKAVFYMKDGLQCVTFVHNVKGRRIKYTQVAAIISLSNQHYETEEKYVYHKKGTYLVNEMTFRINEITFDNLDRKEHKELEQLLTTQELYDLMQDKLIVGCAMENDLASIGLSMGDFETFDLQTHFYKEKQTNLHQPMSLNNIYNLCFNVDFQAGTHSASEDAIGTMRIFLEAYPTQKKMD